MCRRRSPPGLLQVRERVLLPREPPLALRREDRRGTRHPNPDPDAHAFRVRVHDPPVRVARRLEKAAQEAHVDRLRSVSRPRVRLDAELAQFAPQRVPHLLRALLRKGVRLDPARSQVPEQAQKTTWPVVVDLGDLAQDQASQPRAQAFRESSMSPRPAPRGAEAAPVDEVAPTSAAAHRVWLPMPRPAGTRRLGLSVRLGVRTGLRSRLRCDPPPARISGRPNLGVRWGRLLSPRRGRDGERDESCGCRGGG